MAPRDALDETIDLLAMYINRHTRDAYDTIILCCKCKVDLFKFERSKGSKRVYASKSATLSFISATCTNLRGLCLSKLVGVIGKCGLFDASLNVVCGVCIADKASAIEQARDDERLEVGFVLVDFVQKVNLSRM